MWFSATWLNGAAKVWWEQCVHVTWQASLLGSVILVIVRYGRRWPATVRYALLCLALLKFGMPPHWAAPIGLFSQLAPSVAVSPPQNVFGPYSPSATTLNWRTIGLLMHAAGITVGVLWLGAQVYQLRAIARRACLMTRGPLTATLREARSALRVRRPVRLLLTHEALPPMAFGVLRPSILLPQSLVSRLTPAELQAVVYHEVAHHRRGDLLVGWAQLLLGVIWWFNPVLWLVNRALWQTREESCDELLLAHGWTTRGAYCDALLHAARELSRPTRVGGTLALSQRLRPLAARMARIMDPTLVPTARLSLRMVLLLALTGVLVLPGLTAREAPLPQAASAHRDAAGVVPTMPTENTMQAVGRENTRAKPSVVQMASQGWPAISGSHATPVKPGASPPAASKKAHASFHYETRASGGASFAPQQAHDSDAALLAANDGDAPHVSRGFSATPPAHAYPHATISIGSILPSPQHDRHVDQTAARNLTSTGAVAVITNTSEPGQTLAVTMNRLPAADPAMDDEIRTMPINGRSTERVRRWMTEVENSPMLASVADAASDPMAPPLAGLVKPSHGEEPPGNAKPPIPEYLAPVVSPFVLPRDGDHQEPYITIPQMQNLDAFDSRMYVVQSNGTTHETDPLVFVYDTSWNGGPVFVLPLRGTPVFIPEPNTLLLIFAAVAGWCQMRRQG